jgi:hypothetical protein
MHRPQHTSAVCLTFLTASRSKSGVAYTAYQSAIGRSKQMAVDLPELPLPGPSLLEVLFRRMLLQCQQRTQTSGSSNWRCDPKFHCVSSVDCNFLRKLNHCQALHIAAR